MTESIHTGAWPLRVKPKLMLPLHTLTVLKTEFEVLKNYKGTDYATKGKCQKYKVANAHSICSSSSLREYRDLGILLKLIKIVSVTRLTTLFSCWPFCQVFIFYLNLTEILTESPKGEILFQNQAVNVL